jgi:hypothetical protein
MSFTALLDTAIGLALVYLGASLFVTIANEAIAGIFGLRGGTLARHLEKRGPGLVAHRAGAVPGRAVLVRSPQPVRQRPERDPPGHRDEEPVTGR